MKRTVALTMLLLVGGAGVNPFGQNGTGRAASPTQNRAASKLDGVYRLDPAASDKLYSIISGADTTLPGARRERFFDDLIVRLSSPDQLAIERKGNRVSIASSRAPRLTVVADGVTHTERDAGGRRIRTSTQLRGDELTFSSEGGAESFRVAFEPLDGGDRLRVTRRYATEGLTQPVVVRSIYEKVSQVPRWDIYEGRRSAPRREAPPTGRGGAGGVAGGAPAESRAADELRLALDGWITATNDGDIERQLNFYASNVVAFYLRRNVTREFVRAEKERVFERAGRINIVAGEPEVVFDGDGRTAVMRFRKRYRIEGGSGSRGGEVLQELRWQRGADGWKIFSERDLRVIR